MIVDQFEYQRDVVGQDAKVVLDVGSKYGAFVRQYLRIFPQAHVYAFDCAPGAIEALLREFDGHERVEIVPLALLDRPGAVTFHLCEMAGSNSVHPITDVFAKETRNTDTITVEATTLDLFCEQRGIEQIDLLKVDVEGADLQVLRGAERLFVENRIDNLFVEMLYFPYYQNQCWHWEICWYLDGWGYRLYALFPTYWGGRIRYANGLFVKERLLGGGLSGIDTREYANAEQPLSFAEPTAALRPGVVASLGRSLTEHSDVWAELAGC